MNVGTVDGWVRCCKLLSDFQLNYFLLLLNNVRLNNISLMMQLLLVVSQQLMALLVDAKQWMVLQIDGNDNRLMDCKIFFMAWVEGGKIGGQEEAQHYPTNKARKI